ncbi:MAG: Glycosyltransferase, probably involved in cell wall biogenesis [uncultured Acidilobus sp. CIS]|nr:MAG: Glycosyltransferase, probably involved in cell wall biogenesis [uncultured Acidilobus sp. CIS]
MAKLTPLLMALDIIVSLGVSLIYVVGLRSALRSFRSLRPPLTSPSARPVTVVVPARNESKAIGGLMSSLSRIGPSRVVLVDDRSDDGTAETAKLSADGVNLEVVRVDEVPPGWAPKPNAIMAGALRASYGSALLFLDADVFGDLGPLVSAASRVKAGELAAFEPLFVCETSLCKAVQPLFTALLHGFYGFNRALDENDRHSLIYGCCWALDPYTFWELGGMSRVRSSLLEDRELAVIAKGAGVRLVPYNVRAHVRVTSWRGLNDFLELVKRISYGTARSMSPTRFAVATVGLALLLAWPLAWVPLIVLRQLAAAVGPLISYVLQASLAYVGQRAEGLRGPWFLLSPLPALLLLIGFVLSRRSPLSWKGQVIDPAKLRGT